MYALLPYAYSGDSDITAYDAMMDDGEGSDHPTLTASSSSSSSSVVEDHLNNAVERMKHARRTSLRDFLMGSSSSSGYVDKSMVITAAFVSSGRCSGDVMVASLIVMISLSATVATIQ